MLIIKVWCLPKLSERALRSLHKRIVKAVLEIKSLNLHSETDMVVLFPMDMMSYGLGSEILIEISGFFQEHQSKAGYDHLTCNVGKVLEHIQRIKH